MGSNVGWFVIGAVAMTASVSLPAQDAGRVVANAVTSATSPDVRRVSVDADALALRTVLEKIAHDAGLSLVYVKDLIPDDTRVTLHLRDVMARDAFAEALRGTGLIVTVSTAKYATVARREGVSNATESIVGSVTDAQTQQPLRGAKVMLDGAPKGVLTGDDGRFRLLDVASGEHRVTVRMLGYTAKVVQVRVSEGQSAAVEVRLEASVNALDHVVVTGTVVATELKAVPNAITVITAKQLEERGITRIDQLFRGDVPGLFAVNPGSDALLGEVAMFSRGASVLSVYKSAPIKTYVDGIELTDPKWLSQIDATSIERIEILTGPQASTIYGSNALNGVMQIFTKRGLTSRPQLVLDLESGWVENSYSPARAPQHDYNAQLSGIEGRLSYSAGGQWLYLAPWTPARQTTNRGVFGGARLSVPTPIGLVNGDVSLRRTLTTNIQKGGQDQSIKESQTTGALDPGGTQGRPGRQGYAGQTTGMTLGWTPTSWWSHELVVGADAADDENLNTRAIFVWPGDTTVTIWRNHNERSSIRYATTLRVPVTSAARADVTMGADTWQSYRESKGMTGTALYDVPGGSFFVRARAHNTGGFMQVQFGVIDQLFVTYGLRVEWNPTFGADANPNYAPRYGFAYTKDMGLLTAKLRASYGRSTRPPELDQKLAQVNTSDPTRIAYGNYNRRIANPNLGPENQRGGEGGVELYFGQRASLVVTRYKQTVRGLIVDVMGVDSVRSLMPYPSFGYLGSDCARLKGFGLYDTCSSQDADGYTYALLRQNANVASIRNQGWELQGSVTTGPVTTRGTYSWTKSRTLGILPQYRRFFPREPLYQPGASFSLLPEHTWAMGMTYARAQTTIALNLTGIGQLRSYADSTVLMHIDAPRLLTDRWRFSRRSYIGVNTGYALADLNVSHRFTRRVEAVLQVQNVGNYYGRDRSYENAVIGRQSKGGLRIRL